jgi:hypothetical protein
MPVQHLLQGLRAVSEQVPAIRNLSRLRCPRTGTIGVGTAAITGDGLDTWPSTQPRPERGALPVREEIEDVPRSRSTRMVP